MIKAGVQESLVTLYLRLNGYFTSGFIVHSQVPGRNKTELDVLAVRFPLSAELVRGVGVAEELQCWSDGIDFIIGEVKSRKQPLQFNDALRSSREAISTILQWWGYFTEQEREALIEPIKGILAPSPGATAPTVIGPRSARVRAVLFSPEKQTRRDSQSWFIPGPPIFRFIWRCLHPSEPRPECSTTYDFGRWGRELESIVRYFKDETRQEPGSVRDLVNYLNAEAGELAAGAGR